MVRKDYLRTKRMVKTGAIDGQTLRDKAGDYKKLLRRKEFQFKSENEKFLRSLKSNNPREYWKILNSTNRVRSVTVNASIESFHDHFAKLSYDPSVDERNEIGFDPTKITNSTNEFINQPFSVTEIENCIRKLKNQKASGADFIINEYLKHLPDYLLPHLVRLFNIILDSGIVPTDWCAAIIKPLYKNKGPTDDPDNYRGISLLSCVGKLLTSCINQRLTGFFVNCGILGEEQAGFRSGYSTIDHVFVLHSIIDLYLSRGKRIYCAFIDYKKAFDLVTRSNLWRKLIANGVNGKIIGVIYDLYSKAKSCVSVNGKLSDYFSCNIGVRQGENLSPLLFAIYLNDFEYSISRNFRGLNYLAGLFRESISDDDVEFFIRIFALLYADDTIVLAESASELQVALNAVHKFCEDWDLTVNVSKTKVVIFSKGKVKSYPEFKFGVDTVAVVDDYVYLGVTFNYNGLWHKAIRKQVLQASRALFALNTKVMILDLPIDLHIELYYKVVVPILLYGSEVWGHVDLNQMEIFHRKFLKSILKVRKTTPNCMVYGECGVESLENLVNIRILNFWLRLLSGKDTKLSVLMFRLTRKLFCLDDSNALYFKSKWLTNLYTFLGRSGFANMFLANSSDFNPIWLKKSFRQRSSDIFVQNWRADLASNGLCKSYSIIKSDLKIEDYLCALPSALKYTLCKFRCGNHGLPYMKTVFARKVAKGKVPKVISDQCTLCSLQICGDEFHYIMVCPFFGESRSKFIPRNYVRNLCSESFKNLFNDVDVMLNLAKFIQVIMGHFK